MKLSVRVLLHKHAEHCRTCCMLINDECAVWLLKVLPERSEPSTVSMFGYRNCRERRLTNL